jgi:hypothetical protein
VGEDLYYRCGLIGCDALSGVRRIFFPALYTPSGKGNGVPVASL